MAYPFTDKTSSYFEAYGYYDRSSSSLPLASALNGLTSAISGITVPASAINNVVSGSTTAVNGTSLANLVSGLTTAVNASSLVLLVSGLGTGVDASSLNLLSGISAQASSINNVQGLTTSGAAAILNNAAYLGTADSRVLGFYSVDAPTNGLAVTCVTALGITSAIYVLATINVTGTPTTTACIANAAIDVNSTAITFSVHGHDGTAVTAGIATGLILNVIAIGS